MLCSDNGPVLGDGYKDDAVEKLGDHRPAGPLRGGKYSVFEGGTRTPFITRWSGRIRPTVSDEVVSTIDFAASFASLTGQKLADTACLDSHNVLGALLGEPGAKGRTELLQQGNDDSQLGLRAGDWKLVRLKKRGKPQATVSVDSPREPDGPFALYQLSTDPGETTDVSAKFPNELERLKSRLEQLTSARSRPAN